MALPFTKEEVAEAMQLTSELRSPTLAAAELSKRWNITFSADALCSLRAREKKAGRQWAPLSHARSAAPAAPPPAPEAKKEAEVFVEPPVAKSSLVAPDVVEAPIAALPVSAPAIHTSRTRGEAYLIISDLQIPFEHAGALRFIRELVKEYSIAPENIYNVGDEVDLHSFSRFPVDSEATLTPVGELSALRERLEAWAGYFPEMKLCESNHGARILRKAAGAQLPSQLLRAHSEILGTPPGWVWKERWKVKASKHPFQVLHGHIGGQSVTAQRTRSLLEGCSSVWGHLHASPGVHPAHTAGQTVWGCCAGSLIDRDAYAFHYNKGDTFRPWIGCAVIKDGGLVPVLEPIQ